MTNLERYKKDLKKLISEGSSLLFAMKCECYPDSFKRPLKGMPEKIPQNKWDEFLSKLPNFKKNYQNWYSESFAVIKLLLPDRLDNFLKLYEKPKIRKSISYENYVIEDYLHGLNITRHGSGKIVGPDAAISRFEQQLNILESVKRRFESSLFDIKSIVQADLFNSEIEAAHELNKKGYTRGAGAVAGVVLEHHLSQVCQNHCVQITKKNPTINDYNEQLKINEIIEVHNWRFIQRLGDLRNLCDHKKTNDPTKNQIEELIEGVDKITKTIF